MPPISFHQHLRKNAELPASLNCFQIDMMNKKKPKKVMVEYSSESLDKTPVQTKITQVNNKIEDIITSLSVQPSNQVETKYISERVERLHIKSRPVRRVNWKLP